jgi:hypothetical protein
VRPTRSEQQEISRTSDLIWKPCSSLGQLKREIRKIGGNGLSELIRGVLLGELAYMIPAVDRIRRLFDMNF